MGLTITFCPSCGSKKIKKQRKPWTGQFQEHSYKIPILEFYECPECGEKIYDSQAMQKVEEYSPAFNKRNQKKVSA